MTKTIVTTKEGFFRHMLNEGHTPQEFESLFDAYVSRQWLTKEGELEENDMLFYQLQEIGRKLQGEANMLNYIHALIELKSEGLTIH